MRREVGIWSTVFLWIKLIHYWSGSSENTMDMGGRDILFNHSFLCYVVMLRSSNQRWDSMMDKLGTYWGFNWDPSLERPIDIPLLSLRCGELQEKVCRVPLAQFTSAQSLGAAMGVILQTQRSNRAHDASYFMRKQRIWKTTFLGWKWGDKKSVSAGNLKLKEYFTLENMNYTLVCKKKKKASFTFPSSVRQ